MVALVFTIIVWTAGRIIFNRGQKGLHNILGPFLNSITAIPRLWSVS
jgi:hypothetical protein